MVRPLAYLVRKRGTQESINNFQGSHGQGKVNEFRIIFKVRELAGNFDFDQ